MSTRLLFISLVVAGCLSVITGIALGPVPIPLRDVGASLLGAGEPGRYMVIVREIRAPRVVLAYLVGLSLALSGGALQGVFRNPLACPYVLGIASGASAGAAAAVTLGAGGSAALPGGALLGGILAASLVYGLGRSRSGGTGLTLVLAGVALSALFAAVTGSLLFIASGDRRLVEILFWTMGGFSRATWGQVAIVLPVAAVCGCGLWGVARELDALSLGETRAFGLGVRPARLNLIVLGLTTLLTSTAVAFAGTIGFVGLITPHAVRLVLGPDHRRLLPASALAGGIFLVGADLAARTAIPPAELPVGILTALVGAPFFLYLLWTRTVREVR